VNKKPLPNKQAYAAICETFRHNRNGVTAADLAARTALPLAVVKELAPKAADEFNAKLSVTESGEILYSFPGAFKSRYRGARAFFKKAAARIGKTGAVFGKWLFKVWIMTMLVGYFALFMLLALAALVLSVAASSSNNNSSRRDDNAFHLVGGLFNMIIRLWFYSELFNMERRSYYGSAAPARPKGRPLHKAIFSYVFGEGDPNATLEQRYTMALIAFIQANKGVINLEEYIAITGKPPVDADREIGAFCAEFGGSPEVTGEGTIVYRFDDLLLKAEKSPRSAAVPYRQIQTFSNNPAKLNTGFALINTVNLLFGGYFLYHSLVPPEGTTLFNYFYQITRLLLSGLTENTQALLFNVLGVIPVLFSVLFWVIPLARKHVMKKENERAMLENLRKIAVDRIYNSPLPVKPGEIRSSMAEASPASLAGAQDAIIKELSFFGSPDVKAGATGEIEYTFTEMARDREGAKTYRESIDTGTSALGGIVFET
jgi:hypothetical protein